MQNKITFGRTIWFWFLIIGFMSVGWIGHAQKINRDPWNKNQLIEPADLMKLMEGSPKSRPLILDIGPAGVIQGAKQIGPTDEKEGMMVLKKELVHLSKEQSIVFYCGCCPFAKCPDIRPAFRLIQQMGFSNARLLYLPHNLKVDWIDHGYPLQK
ncbi:MAG: rhodanese-like domain-containing protein [Chitinophagaceae bacterium]